MGSDTRTGAVYEKTIHGVRLPIANDTAKAAWQELKEIRFVLWTEQDLDVFRRALEGL